MNTQGKSEIRLNILATNGGSIETGQAVMLENGLDWLYTATADNAALPGTVISVTATDFPGNKTTQEQLVVP